MGLPTQSNGHIVFLVRLSQTTPETPDFDEAYTLLVGLIMHRAVPSLNPRAHSLIGHPQQLVSGCNHKNKGDLIIHLQKR